jgi:hypothetical protein
MEVERKERNLAGTWPLQRGRRIYFVTTETENAMLYDIIGITSIRSRSADHSMLRSMNTSKINSRSLHLSKKINAYLLAWPTSNC